MKARAIHVAAVVLMMVGAAGAETVVLSGIGVARSPANKLKDDFQTLSRVHAIGARCIRLDMDDRWFQPGGSYSENPTLGAPEVAFGQIRDGFKYLDTTIFWAGAQGLKVILSLKHRPGMDTDFLDRPLWDDQENQDLLVDLWMDIAERYRNNSAVVAYHLMHDPDPPDMSDYAFFIQYLIDSIREVDTQHLIIIPEPKTKRGLFELGGDAVPFLYGERLAYGFTEYHPDAFTRQGTGQRPAGRHWPGPFLETIRSVGQTNRRPGQGGRGPLRLKLEAIAPEGATHVSPRVYVEGTGRGRFERVVLSEIPVHDKKTGEQIVFGDTFSAFDRMWWGDHVMWERGTAAGEGSLILESPGGLVLAQPFSVYDIDRLSPTTPNRRYRLTAQVSADEKSEAGIEIVFLETQKTVSDSADIHARFRRRAEWAKKAKAPLFLMEFAATRTAPENDEIEWMKTIRAACEQNGVSWFYRTIRESGVEDYAVYSGPPEFSIDRCELWPELHQFLVESFKKPAAPGKKIQAEFARAASVRSHTAIGPPKTGVWVGAHAPESLTDPSSSTTFSSIMRFTRQVNKLPAWIHIVHPWKDESSRWTSFPEDEFREIAAAGSKVFLSWESRDEGGDIPASFILAGRADTYIRSWADGSRRFQQSFVLSLSRGMNPAAFRHVRDIFEDRGAKNVSWMWAPVISSKADTSADKSDWPGGDYVDWIGLSIYDRPIVEGAGDTVKLFPADEVLEFLRRTQMYEKPVCLAEVGCEAVKDQARWWIDALRSLQKPEFASIGAVVLMEAVPLAESKIDFKFRGDSAYFISKELAAPYFVGGD